MDKQATWLSEATGRDRQVFVPIVPIAEVPAAEHGAPALPAGVERVFILPYASRTPPPAPLVPSSSANRLLPPTPTPTPISSPPARRTKDGRDVLVSAALGAAAGLVAVAVWATFAR